MVQRVVVRHAPGPGGQRRVHVRHVASREALLLRLLLRRLGLRRAGLGPGGRVAAARAALMVRQALLRAAAARCACKQVVQQRVGEVGPGPRRRLAASAHGGRQRGREHCAVLLLRHGMRGARPRGRCGCSGDGAVGLGRGWRRGATWCSNRLRLLQPLCVQVRWSLCRRVGQWLPRPPPQPRVTGQELHRGLQRVEGRRSLESAPEAATHSASKRRCRSGCSGRSCRCWDDCVACCERGCGHKAGKMWGQMQLRCGPKDTTRWRWTASKAALAAGGWCRP